jgi:uncharacterized protein (DUF1330 family)
MLKSALLATVCIAIGAGAVQVLHAAGSPPAYFVAEINVKDRAAYEKELPAVLKMIKEGGGEYVAGGFDKTKSLSGAPPANRVVIIKYPSVEAAEKSWTGGVKKWSEDTAEKKLGDFRQYLVEGAEMK